MATSRKPLATPPEAENSAQTQQSPIEFGREICGDLEVAEQREWLVTNGIGGFASGTISGNLTRRYHGLLIAALNPPVGRTQLVAKFEELAQYDGVDYPLGTNRWASGTVEPHGYRNIQRFTLEGQIPVWQFALADALLEKRIWIQHAENTTYLQYTHRRGIEKIRLAFKVLVNYRDYHAATHAGNWDMKIEPAGKGLRVAAFEGAAPFYLLSAEGKMGGQSQMVYRLLPACRTFAGPGRSRGSPVWRKFRDRS